MSFARAHAIVLPWERGRADHPLDRGGRTLDGITQGTYDRWRRSRGQASRSVFEMTDPERDLIYREDFWEAAHCNLLDWPMTLLQFDAAVQHGVPMANRLLQRALGVNDDGIVGPQTRGAIMRIWDPRLVAREMFVFRQFYYWDIFLHPTRGAGQLAAFGRGWRNRMADIWRHAAEPESIRLAVDIIEVEAFTRGMRG